MIQVLHFKASPGDTIENTASRVIRKLRYGQEAILNFHGVRLQISNRSTLTEVVEQYKNQLYKRADI